MKITGIVNDVIAKTNTNTTDIATIETVASSHIGISGVTAYHLLQGNLAVDNTVTTQGFNTTLYTGNGSTQSITTGVDMATQWGNDASEKFGGLAWIKARSQAYSNLLYDTLRGAGGNDITTNSTASEGATSGTAYGNISSFNNNGFTVASGSSNAAYVNYDAFTYASWNFQTTHRITGTTNHGKAYTCHYNPFTGFTIVKYEGSGIAGHEIPHHLGRKSSAITIKNLSATADWYFEIEGHYAYLNKTDAAGTVGSPFNNENVNIGGIGITLNASANQYIMYGWANSYFDESNKLIGNYEVGVYQGTGASGNKVKTRGKPAWVMIKRIDSTGDWLIYDNQRGDKYLFANSSVAEGNYNLDFVSDGFVINETGTSANTSGGQYLYMVAYDTNSNGGGSYYPRATDTSNLNISNAIIPFANGIDSNGTKITTLSKNETISGLTLTPGKNYVYSKNDGTYGVKSIAPNYGKTNPANGGDFYDILENKWYTSAGVEIPESRNYLNSIVYADNDGSPLYVEELPKTEYKDSLQVDSLNVLSGFNLNQTWQNVTSSRVTGATYTNTTGKPIEVIITTTNAYYFDLYCNNVVIAKAYYGGGTAPNSATAIIPNGSTYKIIGTFSIWQELR